MSATLPTVLDAWRMVSAGRVFDGWLDVSAMPRLAAALVSDFGRCRYVAVFGRDALGTGFVELQLEADLELLCQRSLEPFVLPVQVFQRLGFITDEAQEAALPEGYEPILLDAEGGVRLAELIEDELLLALPGYPVKPGTDPLEATWPAEAEQEPEPAPNPFAALGSLKRKTKQ
jgi:uncharacterized protein